MGEFVVVTIVCFAAYEVELWNLEEKRIEEKSESQRLQIQQLFALHKELTTVRHSQVSCFVDSFCYDLQ